MVGRCKYPSHTSWKWYGAKGITVDPRWLSFETFLEDMGNPPFPSATIERKDNLKPYSKENCIWATPKEQANNNCKTVFLTHNGKTQCSAAWAKEVGLDQERINERKRRGWTDEEAITTPHRFIFLEFNGKRKSARQWAKELGIKYGTVWWRYNRGLSIAEILKI